MSKHEPPAGPSALICWCTSIRRDWRTDDEHRAHTLAFEPGEEFPDGEFAPCPVPGCDGQVRLRPTTPKKKRKKRGKAT